MKYEWKSPEELSKWMKSNIKYDHSSNWRLRSPEEVINSKKGDCHDQSLLEYEVLKSLGYKAGRLFMVEYSSWNQPGGATHTVCWYEKSNKYYWFENAWGGKEGIHGPYKSLDELKSAIADEWNWSGKNDKLYMGNCTGAKVGMDLEEYVSAVVPEKESNKVFHKNGSNISSQENCSFLNVQDCMVEDDIDTMNESLEARLTTNILKNQITIYHGSPDKIDIIMPMSFNAGTKLSKPRMSSFWADEYTAKLFAVYRLIESNGFKVSFTPDMNGLLVKPLDYSNIIVLLKSNPVYLYEKTLDKKYVGIGHSDYFDEYTVDLPVKPDSTSVLQYDQLKDVVENIDKYPTNDDDRIDTIIRDNLHKMTAMNSNILRKIIANDMQYFKSTAKEYKKGQLMNVNTESNSVLEEKRSEIPTKDFGVPSKRKFPLTDAKHVKSAIKFFNYVDEEDEAELARNIKRKAKDFGVVIRCGKQNRLSKYINKEYINEFIAKESMCDSMYAVSNGNIKQHISQGDHIVSATDSYPYTKKEKRKKKDPVDGRISVYMGDGEKLTVNESAEKVPIYIIAYDYSSVFAAALKVATHSNYNHIAIALSPDLEHAYTFARSNKGDHSVKGFTEEPLSQMIKEHGNFYIKVNAVYIPKDAYNKIKSMINDYKKHKDDTTYNYGNLVRGALGIKVDNDDLDSDNMNCSIFVDYMLKNVGVDITDNPNSNLVFPEHLANADMDHDNVVTVYYGNAKGYNKKKVSKMKFLGEGVIEEVKTLKKCSKCGSSNIGVFIKGEPVYICKDCGAYNGTVPFKENTPDDTFFDDLEKQFEDLEFEPIPTDIFNERKDQG